MFGMASFWAISLALSVKCRQFVLCYTQLNISVTVLWHKQINCNGHDNNEATIPNIIPIQAI